MQLLETISSMALWTCLVVCSFQIIFNSYVAAQSISENISENPCPDPGPSPMPPSMDFVLAVARRISEPFYVPMGSKQMYKSYSEYLLGRAPKNQDEIDDMNLRIAVSPMLTMVVTGYEERFIQQCVPAFSFFRAYCFAGLGSQSTNLNPVRRSTNTIIWSDNKTAALITRCVLGFQNDWQVLATTPTLDDSVKLIVLNKIKQLGFNTSLATLGKYTAK